ncbi:MAG: hypothetical protein HQM02_00645 [Magnetococcales bacterium]|nr:hypothetical protein [Magnetococcales bacterium]
MDAANTLDDIFPNQLSAIMRSDGSLRYDMLSRKQFEAALPPFLLEDPGIGMIMELCDRGMFHPLKEIFGNIGLERFSSARQAIGQVLAHPDFARSQFSMALKRALLKAVKSLQDREPKARAAEHLIAQSDAIDLLSREILSLESRCGLAEGSRRQQSACRQDFWRLWEMAWAVRIYSPEERAIEVLEKMYQRYSCLELREGERRKLQLPGGLRDPRIPDEGVVELW